MHVGGIILCGGKSSRMGRSKALLPFGSEVMLQRVVRILQQVVDPIRVVAAQGQELPQLPTNIDIVRDQQPDLGPLQGLFSGLQTVPSDVDAIYLSSCDVPFLQPDFVRRMINLLEDHDICVPHVAGYQHPLAAVYRTSVTHSVAELVAENRLRPVYLFEKVKTRIVEEEELIDVDATFQSLRNLNTPEEYQSALNDLKLISDRKL